MAAYLTWGDPDCDGVVIIDVRRKLEWFSDRRTRSLGLKT